MNARSDMPMGVIENMPAEQYHATMAMSAGGLKRMRQSPAHFYGLQLDPDRPQGGDPTPAMKNGTLVHCALFEPDQVDSRYVVRPADLDGRTKDGKAWIQAQEQRGLIVIDGAQYAAALAQARAARAVPEIAELLSAGRGEVSAFWIDEATGELCKCRPDWVFPANEGVILLDGKTCQDASAKGFSRAIATFDYHLQAAWYSDGYERASGQRVHGFVFAAVESNWPHAAAAYMLDDAALDKARAENRRLLDLYAECRRTNIWPGYATEIQTITLPAWAL